MEYQEGMWEVGETSGLKERVDIWKMKAKMVPVVIGALRAMAVKLEKWLQQFPLLIIPIEA